MTQVAAEKNTSRQAPNGDKVTTSDIEFVVRATKAINARLATDLGATGLTMHERLGSVEHILPANAVKSGRMLATVRNKILNDVRVDHLDDRRGFKVACDEVNAAITLVQSKASTLQKPQEKAGSKFCFIATAVYGDADAPRVLTLREFRDKHLIPSSLGRIAVACYYRASPPVARWLVTKPRATRAVRIVLDWITDRLAH